MNIDWKDALANLKDSGAIPEASEPTAEESTAASEPTAPTRKEKLNIVVERKGRKGKTATIIEGFLCSDDELDSVAQMLKKKIGTGGSARGGEILLQGEWRERAAEILRKEGYRI